MNEDLPKTTVTESNLSEHAEKKRKDVQPTSECSAKKSKVTFGPIPSISTDDSAIERPTTHTQINLQSNTELSGEQTVGEGTTDSETDSQASSVESNSDDLEKEFIAQLHRIRYRVLLQMLLLLATVVVALLISLWHCSLTRCTSPKRGFNDVGSDRSGSFEKTLPLRKGSLQLAMLLLGLEAENQEAYYYPFEDDHGLVVM